MGIREALAALGDSVQTGAHWYQVAQGWKDEELERKRRDAALKVQQDREDRQAKMSEAAHRLGLQRAGFRPGEAPAPRMMPTGIAGPGVNLDKGRYQPFKDPVAGEGYIENEDYADPLAGAVAAGQKQRADEQSVSDALGSFGGDPNNPQHRAIARLIVSKAPLGGQMATRVYDRAHPKPKAPKAPPTFDAIERGRTALFGRAFSGAAAGRNTKASPMMVGDVVDYAERDPEMKAEATRLGMTMAQWRRLNQADLSKAKSGFTQDEEYEADTQEDGGERVAAGMARRGFGSQPDVPPQVVAPVDQAKILQRAREIRAANPNVTKEQLAAQLRSEFSPTPE